MNAIKNNLLKQTPITSYLVVIVLTLIIAWLVFKSCGAKPTEITTSNDLILTEIKAIGKLELTHLSIKDVIEHTIKRNYLPDSRLLMVVVGESAGCIDLTKITQDKIIQQDSLVNITLPMPEICYTSINHQKSKLYNATTFIGLDNDLALSETMYQKAELLMSSDSLQQIIFEKTKENAQLILKPLLQKITHKQVELVFIGQNIKK
jgi:hypothetical protein